MPRMTGGQAIVTSLRAHGVDTVFGLPGGQMDYFFDAMYQEGDALRVIHTRHEQGAAYMAYGYAKSTGRVGTYAVVPGPGLLNSTAALSTAWANNAPVLCISGQVPASGIDSGYGHLHEINDQLGLIRHLTKWAERIYQPADAPGLIAEAFRQLRTGRPRPVEVEMAMDVMAKQADVELPAPVTDYPLPSVDSDRIDSAAKMLAEASRPMIVIGSGALDASAELLAVAEALQAPVMSKRKGRGVIDDRHYLSQNLPAGHRLWADTDAVLAVGTRLMMPLTMWGTDDAMKLIRVDIDAEEITRICDPDIGIVGDAAAVLAALHDALEQYERPHSREDELTRLKAQIDKEIREHVAPQVAYLDVIREVLPDDGIFVDEITQVGFVSWYAFPVYRPRQFITAGNQGTLGYGYATALGVAIANPGKKVVQVSGDGGFMFTMQELSTAVQHHIDLVTVIFNDNKFANVERQQDEWFGGRNICTDLSNPDFVQLAEAFGATGYRAESPDQLRTTLSKAFQAGGPVLIEVPVPERMPSPWRFIMMEQTRKQLCQ